MSRLYIMSPEDNADLFPSTGEDAFESVDRSNARSKSGQETLVEIQARKRSEATAKKQSGNKESKPNKLPRERRLVKRLVML